MGEPPSGGQFGTPSSGGSPLASPSSVAPPSDEAPASEPADIPPEEVTPRAAPEGGTPASGDEPEENIYEVMKQHMVRQKEERDAQNAAWRQGRPGQRSGPNAPAPAAVPPKPQVTKVADLTNLALVWEAARQYLATSARNLETVIGSRITIGTLNPQTGETTLLIPEHFRGYANDRARPRLEEALRAATGLPVKLDVQFTTQAVAAPQDTSASMGVAQRIPPELLEAVKKQPVIQELMKRLDGTVTQVEVLEENQPAEGGES